MKDFSTLKKNLKKDFSNLKALKIAVLSDSSSQFLVQALRAVGYDNNYDLQIWEADFDQVERQIFDTTSELYAYQPEIVILHLSSHHLLTKFNKSSSSGHANMATGELSLIKDLYQSLTSQLSTQVIFYNYAEINDTIFGSYSNKTASSFLFQLRKLNYELMELAAENANFHLCDLSSMQNQIGKGQFFQPSIYINSEMVLSIDALPLIASRTLDIINALQGKFKKCLIIDLDNTIWGGIIGDDGIENIQLGSLGIGKAFSEFQYWIKKLIGRGIIVAVCSKNNEEVAKAPFEKHPDMVLRLDDIAVFIANWDNKPDNIRRIQHILNIGFDAMVFIDDNPFERNIVRENLPEITVPELPEDPADYLEYLYSLNLFETASHSAEDTQRTKLYQLEAERNNEQLHFTDEDSFLESLQMTSLVEHFNPFNTPRVAQLSQRSNQFNLRTVRYSEAEAKLLAASNDHFTFSFTLEDRFGDNGLICVVVLHKEDPQTLFIENWFMSCRVLKRSMEHFVLNTLVNCALENSFSRLRSEYIPTAKNDMVKDHYKNLGFSTAKNYWQLDLVNFELKKCFIKKKELVEWKEKKY